MAETAVRSKAVNLLSTIFCCCFHFVAVGILFVFGTCFLVWFWYPFQFSNTLAERERACCFTLIVLWLAEICVPSTWCPGLIRSL